MGKSYYELHDMSSYRIPMGNNVVSVIADWLTEYVHFIPFKVGQSTEVLSHMYLQEVVRLHGVPVEIISDRDAQFILHYWNSLQEALGTKLGMSSAFHRQIDSQSERITKILDDMLRAYMLDL